MNDEEHIGFGNDPYARDEVRRLIAEWKIRTAVETGTYLGYTARALDVMGPAVDTIEIERSCYYAAVANFAGTSVFMHLGSSPKVLRRILPGPGIRTPVLFYLDAHGETTPVLDELAVIAEIEPDQVLVIHDVKNPHRPEYGFDTYGDVVLDWEYLREAVAACYTNGFTHYHNRQAAGNRVGVLYVTPGDGSNQ